MRRASCLLMLAAGLGAISSLGGCASTTSEEAFRDRPEVVTGTNLPRRKNSLPNGAVVVDPASMQDAVRTNGSLKTGAAN